jgi:signal transduction histidine kinase
MNILEQVLKDTQRLAALKRTALMDTPAQAEFDRLANLAVKIMRVPVALVTLVDEHRQFFKSCIGLPEPWASKRQTPLEFSFCKHVVHTGDPLIISDARNVELLKENRAIQEIGVVAYLGIPLITGDGMVLGSFCAIDSVPRVWSADDVAIMKELAQSVVTEIELRIQIVEHQNAEKDLKALNDKLEAANGELAAFSYSVSHDLRAPLRAISGFADVLQNSLADKLDENGRRYLEQITDGVKRMDSLIIDLLKFSQSTSQPMDSSVVPMDSVVRSAWQELAPAVGSRQIEFSVGTLPPARGDRAMLQQVFVNLLSNAIKFTRTKADAKIEVGAEKRNDENVYFVRDNGIGFDMANAGKVFHVFQRLHPQSEYEGTGIGLATVWRIILRHGGKIWPESIVGKGTTIYFTLPA